MKAKFVKEISVVDPDSGGAVEIAIFKHSNGGMFGLDSSFVADVLPDGDCFIPDPFGDPDFDQDFVQLTGI